MQEPSYPCLLPHGRACLFAPLRSAWDVATRPPAGSLTGIALFHSTVLMFRLCPCSVAASGVCRAGVATCQRTGDYWGSWICNSGRLGPLIGLEIQAKHADHTLQPPFNPLYQRTAVSQPLISFSPSLTTTILEICLSYASRHHFCRLRDPSGCC